MKRIILILSLSFLCHSVDAKCTSSGIWLTGDIRTINKGAVIYLEFYSDSQPIAESLNKKYPVYLRSGNEKIMLQVLEIMRGNFLTTQVVLKPAKELITGSTYELFIDNLAKHDAKPVAYNETLRKYTAITITVTETHTMNNYTLLSMPVITKKTMVLYGCGPAQWVYFNLAPNNQSTGFVKAFLKNRTTGSTTEYIVRLENGVAQVGHGMCSGAFNFDPGSNYEISFAPINNSGIYGEKTSPVLFDPPAVSTETE